MLSLELHVSRSTRHIILTYGGQSQLSLSELIKPNHQSIRCDGHDHCTYCIFLAHHHLDPRLINRRHGRRRRADVARSDVKRQGGVAHVDNSPVTNEKVYAKDGIKVRMRGPLHDVDGHLELNSCAISTRGAHLGVVNPPVLGDDAHPARRGGARPRAASDHSVPQTRRSSHTFLRPYPPVPKF